VLIASGGRFRPVAATLDVDGSAVRRDLALAGSTGLSGRVHTAEGHAIAGAALALTDDRGDVVASGLTGGDGCYRFPDLADLAGGGHTLTVTAEGYRPRAVRLLVPGEAQSAYDVELASVSKLSGVVRSAQLGCPVPEARVTLLDAGGEIVRTVLTDSQGCYDFTDLAGGDYTLIATGYAPSTAELRIGAGTDTGRDVELGHP
jgi:uncharacterized protein YfaS (alpha-2-macroglobulin family)